MNRTQLLTLIATGLGLFMIFLDALIVNVALPDIQRSFAVGRTACSGWWRPTASEWRSSSCRRRRLPTSTVGAAGT